MDPLEELTGLIASGHLSEDALQAMTRIPVDELHAVLNGAADVPNRVGLLAAYLADGLPVDNDERLTAIYESLTIECRLTPRNLAGLTGIDVDVVERFLRDPQGVSIENRYALAVKGSYLINAVNQARA